MTETSTTNMVSGVGFLPLLPSMDFKGNLAENFKMYRQRLEIYLSANGLDDAKDKRKISILLNFIGENGIKIYNSFNLNASESHTFEHVLKKFEAYFEPKKSLTIARNEFFTVTQDEDRLEDYFQRVPDSSPDTKNNCRTTKVKNHNFAVDDIPDIVLDNSMCQPSAKYVIQEPSLEKIVCGSNMATQASPARSRERSRSLDSSTNNANLPTPSSRTSRGGLNEQCSNDKITRSGRVVKKPTRFKDFVDIG